MAAISGHRIILALNFLRIYPLANPDSPGRKKTKTLSKFRRCAKHQLVPLLANRVIHPK
jgi:hypothetical protein